MSNGLSKFLNSTIDVKQGCPCSPTLFGVRIDELEEMVAKFVKEEVVIGNLVNYAFAICGWCSAFAKYFRRCTKAYEDIGKILHAYYTKGQ